MNFRIAAPTLPKALRWRPPSLCAVCHDWGRQRVCDPCLLRFAPAIRRCRRCALAVPPGVTACGRCVTAPPAFERTLAAFDYAYPWDGLLVRFKFAAALDLAPLLAARLDDAIAANDAPSPSLVLPVPLGPQRLRERGYNQAWELARRLATRRGCAANARLLLRVRDAPHQIALPAAERAANVRGAFAVEPLRRGDLDGQCVALVDDVMTTGATADEAARVLLQAGAASVQVWVAARTPAPRDA
ncbi:MAG: ComF family protein [Burkholderiaceae bacterium]